MTATDLKEAVIIKTVQDAESQGTSIQLVARLEFATATTVDIASRQTNVDQDYAQQLMPLPEVVFSSVTAPPLIQPLTRLDSCVLKTVINAFVHQAFARHILSQLTQCLRGWFQRL